MLQSVARTQMRQLWTLGNRQLSTSKFPKGSEAERIAQEIKLNRGVLVYSKTTCPYCSRLKALLQAAKVNAVVHELDKNKGGLETQQALMSVTGQRTVPNVFIGSTHIGGYSDFEAGIKSGFVVKELDSYSIPHIFNDPASR